jgi:N-acetylglucosamine kinase-like BadF-type ATPase
MPFFLAVDAGGTKTDYLLADEHNELARVRSGSIKRMRVSADFAAAELDKAVAELTAKTGIDLHIVTATCIGTAGETVPLVTDWLKEAFAARIGGKLLILGDIEIALDAAFFGEPGILAIAGTGSNVGGRDHTGKLTGAGGYGPVLADQGSGHRIGYEALRAMFLAIDREEPTTLIAAVVKAWGAQSHIDLIALANEIPPPDFSRLTEIVLRCANEGDAIAASVLKKQGEELANLIAIVARRIKRTHPDPAWLPRVAFTGSIMEKVAPVRAALIAALERDFPGIETLQGTADPIQGALWRARQAH